MRKPLTMLLALSLAALATLAATAVPPNLGKALEAQRQLTEKRSQDPGVWNDYGNLLLLARHPAEAETAYRHAVELDPKRASSLFNLGLLEQQRGHQKEALALFEQVIASDPQHAWAHYQTGAIYESWKREGRAIDEYSRAFALDPQLAFKDVNPQVVDSKLVTQAMLRAYREGSKPPEAPKVYDDPGRIAGLLIPSPVPATPETPAAAKPEGKRRQANPANPAPGAVVPGAAVPGAAVPGATVVPGAAVPGGGTVLREGNIERGSPVGQALPPGQTRRPPPLAGRRPGGVAGTQPWIRPQTNVDQDEEDAANAYVPPPVPQPPPNGVIYQPTVQSSGRLFVKVIPGRSVRRPDQVAALDVHRSRW
ncbi:MAG: protein O-GlcNAc transferase [Acidobacteriota bacterium]|nr:protein O-GlcNAc transferase [Acidobacteriota bacterium]